MKKKTINFCKSIIFGIIMVSFSCFMAIVLLAILCGDGNVGWLDVLL